MDAAVELFDQTKAEDDTRTLEQRRAQATLLLDDDSIAIIDANADAGPRPWVCDRASNCPSCRRDRTSKDVEHWGDLGVRMTAMPALNSPSEPSATPIYVRVRLRRGESLVHSERAPS
jgi:hypothetical protein